MTQEDKDFLLKDICARLPYHVRCKIWLTDGTTEEGPLDLDNYADVLQDAFYYNKIKYIKPYLRPMSSMTEEEEEEYWNIINSKSPEMPVGEIPSIETISQCSVIVLDWLLSKGFDIRGLIPRGLAIETLEGMYNK